MLSKFKPAGGAAVAGAIMMTAIFSAGGSGALAETPNFASAQMPEANSQFEASFDRTFESPSSDSQDQAAADGNAPVRIDADTLSELVSAQARQASLTSEQNCLAGAIYFEAKSESLEGQLAVGRVIVARAKSGRFPASYCGVVYQPSQFSFVRGRSMPGINRASRQWQNAAALAKIADAGAWRSPVEGALFFHAASVSPGWRLKRVARIDNHVFYR
jgi:spore germination cell wall hydrolase CwlJ-like protein